MKMAAQVLLLEGLAHEVKSWVCGCGFSISLVLVACTAMWIAGTSILARAKDSSNALKGRVLLSAGFGGLVITGCGVMFGMDQFWEPQQAKPLPRTRSISQGREDSPIADAFRRLEQILGGPNA
jgi:hypothetical protein